MKHQTAKISSSTFLYIVLFALLFFFIPLKSARAQAINSSSSLSQCDTDLGYSGETNVDAGNYNLYIKLGKTLSSSNGVLTVNVNDSCTKTHFKANGYSWVKVGSLNLISDSTPNFTIESDSITSLANANRPSLMLLSADNPPCVPKQVCTTSFKSHLGYIEPTGTSFDDSDIHIVRILDPKQDQVVSVNYFVDSDFMYSTKDLQQFDRRYSPIGLHNVSKVIIFQSGQKIILNERVNQGVSSGLSNFVFTIVAKNKSILQILGSMLIILTILASLISLVHRIYRKRLWTIRHDINSSYTKSWPTKVLQKFSIYASYTQKLLLPLVISSAVILVLNFVNSNGLKTVKVSGTSMTYTLKDNEPMIVSKFSKAWSSLNGQEWVPKRGEVIVFKRAESAFLKPEERTAASYVVKRVIALPGEKVVTNNGRVKVFNAIHPHGFNPDKSSSWEPTMRKNSTEGKVSLTVGKGEVFVLGDNRAGSIDSRFFGPVKVENIFGRVLWHGDFPHLKSI